jgi:hypothetical protein
MVVRAASLMEAETKAKEDPMHNCRRTTISAPASATRPRAFSWPLALAVSAGVAGGRKSKRSQRARVGSEIRTLQRVR